MTISELKNQLVRELPNLNRLQRKEKILDFVSKQFRENAEYSPSQIIMIEKRIQTIGHYAKINGNLTDWPRKEKELDLFLTEINKTIVHVNAPFKIIEDISEKTSPVVQAIWQVIFKNDREALRYLRKKRVGSILLSNEKKKLLPKIRISTQELLNSIQEKAHGLENEDEVFWVESLVGLVLSFYTFFDPTPQSVLRVPIYQNSKWSLIEYTIEKLRLTPQWMGSPITAFGLISADGPPLLLYKGTSYPTDEGFGLSVLTDINPISGVGLYPFAMSKNKIKDWLKQATLNNRKARVYGLSLGGALTLHTAIEFPKFIESVSAFNSPALLNHEVKKWNRRYDTNSRNFPAVHIFQNENDIVSVAGTAFGDGWKLYKVLGPDAHPFLLAHIQGIMAEKKHLILRVKDYKQIKTFSTNLLCMMHLILSIPLFIMGLIGYVLFLLMQKVGRAAKRCFGSLCFSL